MIYMSYVSYSKFNINDTNTTTRQGKTTTFKNKKPNISDRHISSQPHLLEISE